MRHSPRDRISFHDKQPKGTKRRLCARKIFAQLIAAHLVVSVGPRAIDAARLRSGGDDGSGAAAEEVPHHGKEERKED